MKLVDQSIENGGKPMLTKENKKSCRGAIYIFAVTQIMLLIAFLIVLFTLDTHVEMGAYVFLFGSLISAVIFTIYFKHSKNMIYEREYRIKSLDHSINLPDVIKKKFRVVLPDGKQAFYSSKGIIPKVFIASAEGRKATLIEKLSEIDKYNRYKLLYLFQKKYALIEDIWCNRHIVHAEDMELANIQ